MKFQQNHNPLLPYTMYNLNLCKYPGVVGWGFSSNSDNASLPAPPGLLVASCRRLHVGTASGEACIFLRLEEPDPPSG